MARGRRLLFVCACALALTATPAVASPTQESLFMDDNLLLYRGAEVSDSTLQELKALGVDRVRVTLHWRNVAPSRDSATRPASLTDPADPRQYPAVEFDALDHLLRVARRLEIKVLVNVAGGAPDWAQGRLPNGSLYREDDSYKPDPTLFGQWVAAVGRRYDGTYEDENQGRALLPRVDAWSIWNEPNWGGLLQPQSERRGKARVVRRRGRDGKVKVIRRSPPFVPVAPHHYRKLYRAAHAALKATGHAGDTILLGETAPLGNAKSGVKSHTKPIAFYRELFCLGRDLAPLPAAAARRRGCDFDRNGPLTATGVAHHPYSVMSAPGVPSKDPEFAVLADTDRLATVLDAASHAGRLPAALPLWFTEYGYQTGPPDPFRGVSLDNQSRWLAEAEYLTFANPRVAAFTQFLLRDDDPRTQYAENDPRRWVTYQTGLRFADGSAKPAYETYRLPLFAPRKLAAGEPLQLWGFVRAAENGTDQTVLVQFRASAQEEWQTVSNRAVTDPRGYFTEQLSAPATGLYRYAWEEPPPPGRTIFRQTGPRPIRAASEAVLVQVG